MKAILAFGLAALLLPAVAEEIRSIVPIERKPRANALQDPPRIEAPLAVNAERIADAMRQIARAWNDDATQVALAPDFRERERVVRALQARVPHRATLRLVAIRNWRVVEQFTSGAHVITKVVVTAHTRIEVPDAAGAPQLREGVNDYYLTLLDSTR